MDKALKQRLVGATVIIILAVIVLPMLFSGRSDVPDHESSQIKLPPQPKELSFDKRRFPVGEGKELTIPTDKETAGGNEEAAAGTVNEQAAAPVTAAPVEAGPAPETHAAAAVPAPASGGEDKATATAQVRQDEEKPAADVPRYLVQVASFSSEQKANELAARLQAQKLPVLMDVVEREAARFHRVRVGPFAERSEAEALVSRLTAQSKDLSPRILDLRPDDTTPVSNPSDPLVRWVVQVGSFSEAKNAEKLVARLRAAGYAVFSQHVSSAAGSVYQVRIGPEIRREDAVALAAKVKAEEKLSGFVMTME